MTILHTVKVRAFCYLFCKSNLIKRRRPSQARSNKSTLNNCPFRTCLFMSYFMLIFQVFYISMTSNTLFFVFALMKLSPLFFFSLTSVKKVKVKEYCSVSDL